MEQDRVSRIPIIRGFKKSGCGIGAERRIWCGEGAYFLCPVSNMPKRRVVTGNERELVFVGIEKEKAEGKVLVHRIDGERLVDGLDDFEGWLFDPALDGHPDHATEIGDVEERGDARFEGLREDDAIAIVREAEEIKIEAGERHPFMDGDAHLHL